jgi:hypothetical protein
MEDLRGGDEDEWENRDDRQGKGDLGCAGVAPFCFRRTHWASSPSTPPRAWTYDLMFNHTGIMQIYRYLMFAYINRAAGSDLSR